MIINSKIITITVIDDCQVKNIAVIDDCQLKKYNSYRWLSSEKKSVFAISSFLDIESPTLSGFYAFSSAVH